MMSNLYLFRELLRITIGKANVFNSNITDNDWRLLYAEAQKQSLVGVCFSGIERLPKEQLPYEDILYEWYGAVRYIEHKNKQQHEKIQKITQSLAEMGIRSCLLKGLGTAALYPRPLRRQSGDIDLWINCDRDTAKNFAQKEWEIDHIDVKNMVAKDSLGLCIEFHFIPSWFYNPFVERKFRKWYKQLQDLQLSNMNNEGFNVPTIGFNLVYSMVHIYKHLFDEGIGLRQIMDYYYILLHSTSAEREEAFMTLQELGMARFVASVMYVLVDSFEMDEQYLLCSMDAKRGRKLERDIYRGGNFGYYDERNIHGKENRITRGIRNIRHNISLLRYYPAEVMWSPMWKCWHWYWRKKNSYL